MNLLKMKIIVTIFIHQIDKLTKNQKLVLFKIMIPPMMKPENILKLNLQKNKIKNIKIEVLLLLLVIKLILKILLTKIWYHGLDLK